MISVRNGYLVFNLLLVIVAALASPNADDPSNGSAIDNSDNHIGSAGISTVSAG